jgi:hypothetical protein
MSTSVIDRRIAALLVSLLLAVGFAATSVQPAPGTGTAQTHALQTHA